MDIKELSVVKLKDGREGTIVHSFSQPCVAYLIELSSRNGEIETVEPEQIEKVIWEANSA